MLKYRYPYYNDTTINLSNSPGDDYKPVISFYSIDTTNVAVFWTHEENGKQDIWMAKTVFAPILGAVTEPPQSPGNYSLEQNYPNPFNPSTNISFSLKNNSHAALTIYNSLGQKVEELLNKDLSAGNYNLIWNAENFASGIYYYELKTDTKTFFQKMILLK